MIFDARDLARAWLPVALASSADKDRPGLSKTVHIEQHEHGVRLVATDSYVLLHAWIPDHEHTDEDAPGFDESPSTTATAMDPHGRAKGFLAHALKLAADAEKAHEEATQVTLRLNVAGTAEPGQLHGMEAHSVVLEMPGVERVTLLTYEGRWADWRPIVGGFRGAETGRVAVNPEVVGRLCRVHTWHAAAVLRLHLGGEIGAVHVDVDGSWPRIQGVVMPCRWDFDSQGPRDPGEEQYPPPIDPDDDVDAVRRLVGQAAELLIREQLGSTALLQRRLGIGYARASKLMDLLEQLDVVGEDRGAQARNVLIDSADIEAALDDLAARA